MSVIEVKKIGLKLEDEKNPENYIEFYHSGYITKAEGVFESYKGNLLPVIGIYVGMLQDGDKINLHTEWAVAEEQHKQKIKAEQAKRNAAAKQLQNVALKKQQNAAAKQLKIQEILDKIKILQLEYNTINKPYAQDNFQDQRDPASAVVVEKIQELGKEITKLYKQIDELNKTGGASTRKNSYEAMTVKDLKERAAKRKIKGYSSMKKSELIAILRRK